MSDIALIKRLSVNRRRLSNELSMVEKDLDDLVKNQANRFIWEWKLLLDHFHLTKWPAPSTYEYSHVDEKWVYFRQDKSNISGITLPFPLELVMNASYKSKLKKMLKEEQQTEIMKRLRL